MSNPERLASSGFFKSYATVASDADLSAVGGGPTRWFTVGVAGDVKVDGASGAEGEIITCAVGHRYWVQATKVYTTGTTATKITFYW